MKHVLDVRGLVPCEPFERILDTLARLPSDHTLEVLIDREPQPLYVWLAENGWQWHTAPTATNGCQLQIQRA